MLHDALHPESVPWQMSVDDLVLARRSRRDTIYLQSIEGKPNKIAHDFWRHRAGTIETELYVGFIELVERSSANQSAFPINYPDRMVPVSEWPACFPGNPISHNLVMTK